MRLLVLGLATCWRFQRVQHRPSRRCTPVTATHLMAMATLTATTATVIATTIIATTPTILATTTIATSIGTKKNFGAASTGRRAIRAAW